MVSYKNISGNTAVQLTNLFINKFSINMSLCNTHTTDELSVDFYLTKTKPDTQNGELREYRGENGNFNDLSTTTSTYYILKNVVMPAGSTLILDDNYFNKNFVPTFKEYHPYIKLKDSGSTLDVVVSGATNTLNNKKY